VTFYTAVPSDSSEPFGYRDGLRLFFFFKINGLSFGRSSREIGDIHSRACF